jgi:hypothetical protein
VDPDELFIMRDDEIRGGLLHRGARNDEKGKFLVRHDQMKTLNLFVVYSCKTKFNYTILLHLTSYTLFLTSSTSLSELSLNLFYLSVS